jgi:hypothetical protein
MRGVCVAGLSGSAGGQMGLGWSISLDVHNLESDFFVHKIISANKTAVS